MGHGRGVEGASYATFGGEQLRLCAALGLCLACVADMHT